MPRYSKEDLKRIFDRASGKCHICHTWLSFDNYGKLRLEGAWEVDHSVPLATGGTFHFNNLYPACVVCNRSKGKKKASSVRASKGKKRPPLSAKQRERAISNQTAAGAALGLAAGYLLNPVSGILTGAGMLLGGLIGRSKDPDD